MKFFLETLNTKHICNKKKMQKEVSASTSLSPSPFLLSLSPLATIHIKTHRERGKKERRGWWKGEREITEEGRDISSCCRLIIKIFNSLCFCTQTLQSAQQRCRKKRRKGKNHSSGLAHYSDPQNTEPTK